MGVDITHIIRHNFRQTHNVQLSIEFTRKTIDRLKKELFIQNSDDDFEMQYDEEFNEIIFRLPIYNVEFFYTMAFGKWNHTFIIVNW